MATYLPTSANASDTYVTGRGAAWFAFAMTLTLMLPARRTRSCTTEQLATIGLPERSDPAKRRQLPCLASLVPEDPA